MIQQKVYKGVEPPKLYNIPMPKYCGITENRALRIGSDWCVEAEGEAIRVVDEYVKYLRLSEKADKKIRVCLSDMDLEAYRIELDEGLIEVRGGSVQALRYALYTLADTSKDLYLPKGTIEDKPLLNMRGYHLNLCSLERATLDELLLMVRWAAEAKINTLLIEYDNHLPFKKYPNSRSPFALTENEVRKLVLVAEEYGMEVIPLMQTFGHLEYMLRDPACAEFRELPDSYDQLCPLKDASMEFIKGQIDELIEWHPNMKYLHLGGDETRKLGACPKCAEFVMKHGIGKLYSKLMNQVIDYVCSKGITPLLYDDMLCAHPDAIDELDRRAVIVYWDYWATAPKVPHLIARYGMSPMYTYDRRWENGEWTGELDDVARRILEVFGEGGVDDVEESLGEAFMKRYGRYVGEDFPKYFKAFPYLEYYMDKGFKVICMPTSMGNTDNYVGMPNQARFAANIRVACERVAEANAMGVITSAWYPFPMPMYPLGICTAAYYSWGIPDYADSLPDWRK